MKKIITLLLVAVMTASLFSVAAAADELTQTSQEETFAIKDGIPVEAGDENISGEIFSDVKEESLLTDDDDAKEGTLENKESALNVEDGGSEDAIEDITPDNENDLDEEMTGTQEETGDVSESEDVDAKEGAPEENAKAKKAPAKEEETSAENTADVENEKTTEQKDIDIKSIKLDINDTELATGKNLKLKATITPEDATDNLVWTSSDEKIATVDKDGRVTAIRYGKVTITAAASKDESVKAECVIQTRFYDVNNTSKYYYKPVYWAAENGITQGYDNVYFAPEKNCSRREMMIFLWRYSGRPASSGKILFSDVKYAKTSDSYKAIQWGVYEGIIKGYDDGTFRPNANITRKDALIMIYRMAGKPKASGNIPYADANALNISKNSDTKKSILWANTVGITKGYADGTFKPLSNCLREHIVTFLYRYKDKKSQLAYLATPEITKAEYSGNIDLAWKKVANAKNYDIYRYIYKDKAYKKISSSNTPSFVYKNAKDGDVHKFKIVARSGNLSSDESKETVVTCLQTVKLKKAEENTTGIKVTWEKLSGAKEGYRVYRKTANSSWKSIGDTKSTSWQDDKCESDVKYTYTVRAITKAENKTYLSGYNKNGVSAKFSDPVMVMARNRLAASGGTLRGAFNWAVSIPYRDQPWSSTASGYASYSFKNGVGDCLGKAAVFCYMARALGYQANLIYGYVPRAGGGTVDHGWVEIYSDGAWYVCDPDFEMESGRNGYFIHYGQSGTWMYNKERVIPFR